MKMLRKTLLTLAVLGALVAPAQAKSLTDAEYGRAANLPFLVSSTSTESMALKLWYVGSSTQSQVAITSTTILFYAPNNVLDTTIGTGGWLDISAAANDTFGELCDTIQGNANYGCLLLGGKRNDSYGLLRDNARAQSADLKGAGGFDVGIDTNPIDGGGNGIPYVMSIGATPNTGRHLCVEKCVWNVNSGGATAEYCEMGSISSFSLSKLSIIWVASLSTGNTQRREKSTS